MEGSRSIADTASVSINSSVSVLSTSIIEPVRVYIRIRPALSSDTNTESIQVIGHDHIQVNRSSSTAGERVFRFDRIFGPKASQDEVYHSTVHPLVCKFYEGINCTIFAYGQTGTGKTYTIGSGCYQGEEGEGIIPRTLEDIFKEVRRDGTCIGDRLLRVSYLEIYKEELRDLLRDTVYPSTNDIHIREDDNGQTVISGIVEEEVRTVEDAIGWLQSGNTARITSATEMNTHSSRSHAVFTISMVQEKTIDYNGEAVTTRLASKFHFVDLAGSERVSRTNNTGERFKESIHINGGLLALGNVISAFADKRRRSSHIPYRDSKITRILKDSLGGSALTVMITCLSPSNTDLPETLNALKYAKRARNIRNHPVVNHASDKDSHLLFSMREEIQTLRNELHRVKETRPVYSATPPLSAPMTIHTVDSSVMVELGDNGSYVSSLKKKLQLALHKQKIILEKAGSAYDHMTGHMTDHMTDEDQRSMTDIMEKLLDFIKSNMASQEEGQEVSVLCKSTNTSLDGLKLDSTRVELDEAIDTITELKKQLKTAEDRVELTDAELDLLKSEYHNLTKDKTTLDLEIHQLRKEVHYNQDKLVKQDNQVNQDNQGNTGDTIQSAACDVYSLLHGTVSDLQDYDEAECDTVLRELTDIMAASRQHRNQSDEVSNNCPSMLLIPVENNEMNKLQDSIASSQHQLHHSEKRLLNAQHAMKSLNLQIRFKEELIKELVKNNSTFQCLNKAYQIKISNLEKEHEQLKTHITKQKLSLKVASDKAKSTSVISESGSSAGGVATGKDGPRRTSDKELSASRAKRRKSKSAIVGKSDIEAQEKKLKETESKLLVLQRRRQETLRILNMGEKSDRRISELEGEMDRLRRQQTVMKKKLKGEFTKKRNLEDEVHQYKRQIKALTESNKQQSQVIKVKTGEVALAQRKLRGYHHSTTDNHSISQKWIDQEIEKIVQERQALEIFQKELLEREAVIKSKETLLLERNQLERRRSITSREGLRLSQQMESINQRIVTKEKLKASFSGLSLNTLEDEIDELRMKQTQLADGLNRSSLHASITEQSLLSSDEETRLMEVTEQIEVLEMLLQIKNQLTSKLQSSLSVNKDQLHNITTKISSLSSDEARPLLLGYISKVIKLKQYIDRQKTKERELKGQLMQRDKVIEQLEQSLDQSQIDKELRLTRLHKEHAKEVQLLLNQVTTGKNDYHQSSTDDDVIASLQSKVKELEKDLYYYKKVARDLKHQVKEQVNSSVSHDNKDTTSTATNIHQTIVLDSLETMNT